MAAGGLRDPDRRSVARRGRRPWPPRRCCRALSEVFSWEDLGEMQVEIPSTWRRGKGVPVRVARAPDAWVPRDHRRRSRHCFRAHLHVPSLGR